MTEIVYLNGSFIAADQAKVSAFDRGFLFADGVYEVIPVYDGKMFKQQQHFLRLYDSIKQLNIIDSANDFIITLGNIATALIDKNHLTSGAAKLYIQVTRGSSGERTHIANPTTPTVFMTIKALDWPSITKLENGISAITLNESRAVWQKHKTIANLQNIIGLQKASQQNAAEAIWHYNDCILEGCHSNVFCVSDGVLYTPEENLPILIGVTRNTVLEVASEIGIKTCCKKISLADLNNADEIFVTGSTKTLLPVTKLDGKTISQGSGGKIWRALFAAYQNCIKQQQLASNTND
jgi:D-alanine transaminase